MPVYSNEEENKRKKLKQGLGVAKWVVPAPVRMVGEGAKEAVKFAKAGFSEAAAEPSAARRFGKGLRTAVTLPVAATYGAFKEPARGVKKGFEAGKEVASAFAGHEPPTRQPVTEPVEQQAPSRITPPSGNVIKTKDGRTVYIDPETDKTMSVDKSGRDVTGQTATSPQRMTAEQPETAVEDSPSRRKLRDYTYGGFTPQEREETPEAPLRRVSDIAAPETIGGVPGYRRKVEAAEFDIGTEQRERAAERQQGQFEAGQEQEERRLTAGQEIKERELAGTEQAQQANIAAKRQAAGMAAGKDERFTTAMEDFKTAKTPADKREAARVVNALSGRGVEMPKRSAPAWKPPEVSSAVDSFSKNYQSLIDSGQLGEDAPGFHSLLKTRDPKLYKEAYGSIAPSAMAFIEDMQGKTDKELEKNPTFKGRMKKGETVPEMRQRIMDEYRRMTGG